MSDTDYNNNNKISLDTGPTFGVRHVQVILLFFLIALCIGMRVHISVAIVAMMSNETNSNSNIPIYSSWTNKNVILSSYFWGYITLQLFAGELGRKYGTKTFLIGSMLVNSTACILVPIMASCLGSYGVIICRVIQGISSGFFYSSTYNLLGSWVPTPERSRLGTIALSGDSFGSIVTTALVGYMCSIKWGWPSTFYLFGSFGYCWTLIWYLFGANSPAVHPNISKQEKSYIENSLRSNEHKQKRDTPWKAILTSLPFWSISVAYFGQNWGFTTLSTEVPTFYYKMLGFDISSDGLLAAIPSLICLLLSFLVASIADFVINNQILSRTLTRKMFTTIGSVVPAISLCVVGFLSDQSRGVSVIMVMLPSIASACFVSGNYMSHVDIAPNYAGVIMGLSDFIPNLCNILAPLYVQLIVKDETDRSQWRTVFLTSAAMFAFSNLFYIIFASGEVQWWNNRSKKEVPKRENKRELRV